MRQEIDAVLTKFGEAFNKREPAAMAALYTQDAMQLWSWSPLADAVACPKDVSLSPGKFRGLLLRCFLRLAATQFFRFLAWTTEEIPLSISSPRSSSWPDLFFSLVFDGFGKTKLSTVLEIGCLVEAHKFYRI